MNKENVVGFPGRFEAEIKLAEKSHDLVLERMARGRLPASAVPLGDVSALIDAVGEMIYLAALEADGRKLSRKKMVRAVDQLREAVEQIAAWPAAARAMVIAPLAVTMEELEIEWLAVELMAMLPAPDGLSEKERDLVLPALLRTLPVHARIAIEEREWSPDFEEVLRGLRALALESPDDEDLSFTLKRAVVFHAVLSRDELLTEERRALAAAEPLPDPLVGALDELQGDVFEGDLIRLSLHLVLADLVAAGLVPEAEKPRSVAAAVYLALAERDEPEERVDLLKFAKWAQTRPQNLKKLKAQVDPVFDWMPPGCDELLDARQQNRWRTLSGKMEFMPARWLPDGPKEELPPYTTEAALARFDELPDVVWMMVDGVEAVRFISEAFSYGGDAPEEMDVEIGVKAIRLWKQESLIMTEMDGEDWDDDDWEDDDWDDDDLDDDEFDLPPGVAAGLPGLVTTDGEPVIFCKTEYEVKKRDRRKVVKRLDGMAELQRKQDDGSERWVWTEDRDDAVVLLATIELEDDRLWLDTMSVGRAARAGGLLVEPLGDLITLIDVETERPTPQSMAQLAAAPPGIAAGGEIPPELEAEMVHNMLEKHYRAWPDDEIPALGGMTPREAVKDPEGRERVIELLRDFEQAGTSAPNALSDFDLGFLWEELGLKRDE